MGWPNPDDGVPAIDGNSYHIYAQDKDNSCGVACVIMVARMISGKKLDGSTVRHWFGKAEGAKNINRYGIREFDSKGSTQQPIISVIAEYLHVKSACRFAGAEKVAKFLPQTSPKKPAIIGVDWLEWNPGTAQWVYSGGGHWIVAAGLHNNQYIFLDPSGIIVNIPRNKIPVYSPVANVFGYMNDIITTY